MHGRQEKLPRFSNAFGFESKCLYSGLNLTNVNISSRCRLAKTDDKLLPEKYY